MPPAPTPIKLPSPPPNCPSGPFKESSMPLIKPGVFPLPNIIRPMLKGLLDVCVLTAFMNPPGDVCET